MILDITFSIGNKETRIFLKLGSIEESIPDTNMNINGATISKEHADNVLKEWRQARIIN